MMAALFAVPYSGKVLAFLFSPVGRIVLIASLAFAGGWHAKGKIDDAATARAVLAKTRIDLETARQTAAQADKVADELADTDANNQEIIRDLQEALSKRPPNNACALDPAAADRLRRLR
jgi:hypothetical protein